MSAKPIRKRRNTWYNETYMNPNDQPAQDFSRPVAYDVNGQPLYAHPPTVAAPAQPQVVHLSRSVDPQPMSISPEVAIKHEQSKKLYPTLNLSEGEYIINAVRRHPIGLVLPMLIGLILLSMTVSLLFNYDIIAQEMGLSGEGASLGSVIGPILLFALLVVLGTYVAYYVYTANKFFLTNESVIQEIQLTLFSRHEQTVSLSNIEDASYRQHGIIQQIFNYGSIRLSTEGDETTYRFTYVANPKAHIATLNNAVEAFKNGRPMTDSQ